MRLNAALSNRGRREKPTQSQGFDHALCTPEKYFQEWITRHDASVISSKVIAVPQVYLVWPPYKITKCPVPHSATFRRPNLRQYNPCVSMDYDDCVTQSGTVNPVAATMS